MHAKAALTALFVDLYAQHDTAHIDVGSRGNPGSREMKVLGPGSAGGQCGFSPVSLQK